MASDRDKLWARLEIHGRNGNLVAAYFFWRGRGTMPYRLVAELEEMLNVTPGVAQITRLPDNIQPSSIAHHQLMVVYNLRAEEISTQQWDAPKAIDLARKALEPYVSKIEHVQRAH